jgi:hypothetical protein
MKHLINVNPNRHTTGIVDGCGSIFEAIVVFLGVLVVLIPCCSGDRSFRFFRMFLNPGGDILAMDTPK